jgi:putative hydrolase of the HAD superfamily
MYKNYVFDLYGTLIDVKKNWKQDYIWDKMSQLYCYHGACYDPDEFKEKFEKYLGKIQEINMEDEHSDIDIEDIFFQLFKKKDVKPKNKIVRESARVFLILITEKM